MTPTARSRVGSAASNALGSPAMRRAIVLAVIATFPSFALALAKSSGAADWNKASYEDKAEWVSDYTEVLRPRFTNAISDSDVIGCLNEAYRAPLKPEMRDTNLDDATLLCLALLDG